MLSAFSFFLRKTTIKTIITIKTVTTITTAITLTIGATIAAIKLTPGPGADPAGLTTTLAGMKMKDPPPPLLETPIACNFSDMSLLEATSGTTH